jgi:hypothetical protein
VSPALIDGTFLVAAVTIGLVGFRTTYGDLTYLLGGLMGLVAGVLIAHVASRLDLPAIAAAATALVAFAVLGGVAVRSTAIAGVIPTASTVRALLDGSVHGWAQMLTLLPPIGSSGPLLAIPYLLGLTAGVAGFLLASRTRHALLPVLAPVTVLILSILFGTQRSASLMLQGAAFTAVVVGWMVVRYHRGTRVLVSGSSRRVRRVLLAALMLAGSAAVGRAIGSDLPFAHSHHRVVLRNYVQPPFDPSAYPSPLAGFRHWVLPSALGSKTLLVVHGLPRGSRLRFATLDLYDGLVWGVGKGSTTAAGSFARVGPRIPAVSERATVTVEVDVHAYTGVWLPDVGETRGVSFSGPDADAARASYRYNLTTGAAVVPLGIKAGQKYTLNAAIAPAPTAAKLAAATPAGALADVINIPPAVAQKAKAWAGTSSSVYAQLQSIASHLREGSYSDGRDAGFQSLPGHGQGRLQGFLTDAQLVGDDEQYAAAFALLATALGDPARVVIGAIPKQNGEVKGSDVHAWVEVDLGSAGWVPFDVTPPKNRHPHPQPPQQLSINHAPNRVPPATAAAPPTSESTVDTSKTKSSRSKARGHALALLHVLVAGVRYGGPPIGLIVLLVGSILGLKHLRRRRRRTRGSPVQRISGGWRELVDLAVDLGSPRPERRTRRLAARVLPAPELIRFAALADAANFGPVDPDVDAASAYWRELEELRDALLAQLNWRRRIVARLNVASFIGVRPLRKRFSAQPMSVQ